MARLLVIADDFTGALDTGVQFVQSGAKTLVSLDCDRSLFSSPDADVIVVDTETRHMDAQSAYSTVFAAVRAAKECGINCVYKKTDSALRGNIGAELAAVLDATCVNVLAFVPAFPAMNRTVKDGQLYIDGLPAAESVFARDPFEPVRMSSVAGIIALQTDIAVKSCKPGDIPTDGAGRHIAVFDCTSAGQMDQIGNALGAQGLAVSAGCAGFAPVLAKVLGFEGRCGQQACAKPEASGILVVNGSVNPVTSSQINTARDSGIPVITLTPSQKTGDSWLEDMEGRALVGSIRELVGKTGSCVIDAGNRDTMAETDRLAGLNGLSAESLRKTVASTAGRLAVRIMDTGCCTDIMCIGGDTLLALAHAAGTRTIKPLRELESGVVLTRLEYGGKDYSVVTKSGGFGGRTLIRNFCTDWRDNG